MENENEEWKDVVMENSNHLTDFSGNINEKKNDFKIKSISVYFDFEACKVSI